MAVGPSSREVLVLRLQLVKVTYLPFLRLQHLVFFFLLALPPSFISGSDSQEWELPVSWMIVTAQVDLINTAPYVCSSYSALLGSHSTTNSNENTMHVSVWAQGGREVCTGLCHLFLYILGRRSEKGCSRSWMSKRTEGGGAPALRAD